VTASLTVNPPPSDITCPPGQRLELASVSYTNVTLTDTTHNVSISLGDFSSGCLLPNVGGGVLATPSSAPVRRPPGSGRAPVNTPALAFGRRRAGWTRAERSNPARSGIPSTSTGNVGRDDIDAFRGW
jgi:hypothetical protein